MPSWDARTYSRYATTPVITDRDKERNYIRERIDTSPHYEDYYYPVKPTDRVDLLAYRLYGRPDLWWVIADYNDLRFPLILPEGIVLRCPSYEHLMNDLLEG